MNGSGASDRRPQMLFVSPRFLFPVDSGGKIRTTQILRGLHGGEFSVRLAMPANAEQLQNYRHEVAAVCDDLLHWPEPTHGLAWKLRRAASVVHELPVPVRSDWSTAAAAVVRDAIASRPDVVVFDFLHSVVLAPEVVERPSVLFTHNVETEIFARHAQAARGWLARRLWASQAGKMRRFESAALRRFDVVVAVSDRDARAFAMEHAGVRTAVIPTGVDPEFFEFHEPVSDQHVVFCGSMDWIANQQAINFFLDEVWDRIAQHVPEARFTVVGRAPPASLVEKAARRGVRWTFTGYVDDVRPHMRGAAVSVIPMLVGGGTRLKAYEAMAAGVPIVSTAIGIEGLPVCDGTHYLLADRPDEFAAAVVRLLRDSRLRQRMARDARELVESRFSFQIAADVFANAARDAIQSRARS